MVCPNRFAVKPVLSQFSCGTLYWSVEGMTPTVSMVTGSLSVSPPLLYPQWPVQMIPFSYNKVILTIQHRILYTTASKDHDFN